MPPKHIMFLAQDLGQKLGLLVGTDLAPLQEALIAAYYAGINDALNAASTSGAGPHVLGAIEAAGSPGHSSGGSGSSSGTSG